MPSSKIWLAVLFLLNLGAIGFSEVQRRALIQHTNEMRSAAFEKVDASIAQSSDNLLKASRRLEDVSLALLARSDQLLAASGNVAERTRDEPNFADRIRGARIRALKEALIKYRSDNKVFPQLPTGQVANLAPALVGKYLTEIPEDPAGHPMYYTVEGAPGGDRFGLFIRLENGTECVTGHGVTTGWWGNPPKCQF